MTVQLIKVNNNETLSINVGVGGKGRKAGYLDKSYLEIAELGYKGIINRLKYNEQGVIIDNICVGTGVGNYKFYCDRPTSENDLHGAGAFILMCTEVYKAFHEE